MPQRLGRTTRNLLRKLPCPLIVVPGCVDSSRRIDGNAPIVVGMGHSDATEAAVKWAADLGDTREATVAMVHATGDAPVFEADSALDLANYVIHPDDRTAWSNRDVDRFAGEVQELSEHDLDVRVATPPGLPAVRLAEASTVASLLVIGQHWSTLTAGHHVTQPLRYALTHARCPVAVVPEWCGAS
jgi:nucleotide-binding universal stress UspA family protein